MSNVIIGEPRFKPPQSTKTKAIVDVVMFVAGTTDPINTKGLKHEANTGYWQATKENFWAKVKELKPQFHDLHIEGSFFSWSGDNDTAERNKAADRLLDLFVRVYPGFKRKEVHLHLIGHSHGGNVINEFTNLISHDKRFPEPWKIKSITYLSTPFFKKKHQLNHAKIHSGCKIINVHNEYDLTQRLVADFSLVNLEIFLQNFNMKNFEKGTNLLKSVDTAAFEHFKDVYINNHTEGPFIWREATKAFLAINALTAEFIKYIKGIDVKTANLDKERDEFVSLLNQFLQWTFNVHGRLSKNSSNRSGGYGRTEFLQDLQITTVLDILNALFDIKTGVKDSYILHLLARVFAAEKGLTDSIEDNAWTPKEQTKGLSIQDLNITEFDTYHSRKKKKDAEKFITGAIAALQKNNLEELLMRLFSQFVTPKTMTIINYVLHGTEVVVFGDFDTQITTLRKNLKKYGDLITEYHAFLVTDKDKKEIKEIIAMPGSVPYLAMASHSLSHTRFWPEVETGLRGAFSSGINPGYKKK
jgi:hypothetical protein